MRFFWNKFKYILFVVMGIDAIAIVYYAVKIILRLTQAKLFTNAITIINISVIVLNILTVLSIIIYSKLRKE